MSIRCIFGGALKTLIRPCITQCCGQVVTASPSLRRIHIEDQSLPELEDMDLKSVVGLLQQYAPPSLAGSWDNVGLLIEPTPPHQVNTLFLTNDLTPTVLEEAIQNKADMILSYHPPLFVPVKRITQHTWKERIITKCIENRIAVYSPHTSFDAVPGGVNDWLIGAFDLSECKPVEPTMMQPKKYGVKRVFKVPATLADNIIEGLNGIKGVSVTSNKINEELVQIDLLCNLDDAPTVMGVIEEDFKKFKSVESYNLDKVVWPRYGMGRVGTLKSPISVDDTVNIVKQHLNLKHVRLARAEGKDEVLSVAVCAGSGSSVLKSVPASVYVTGEMSHHEVLNAVCKGTHVILCDHSNTERGFLSVLQSTLDKMFKSKIKIHVSSTDRDPLEVV